MGKHQDNPTTTKCNYYSRLQKCLAYFLLFNHMALQSSEKFYGPKTKTLRDMQLTATNCQPRALHIVAHVDAGQDAKSR